MSSSLASTNFAYLHPTQPQLARLGELAEKYWLDDANTALIKARQFAELLAQTVAAQTGLLLVPGEGQLDLLICGEALAPYSSKRNGPKL